MAPSHCPVKDDPNTVWPPFCPNIGAAYFYAILFAITLILHITQAIVHRKAYSWVISMSALWQLLAYAFRIASINSPTKQGLYIGYFVLILLAPLWANAYTYMVLGRMVYNFTNNATVLGVKAWRFTLIFVVLDIVAFIVQLAGATSASGDIPDSQIMRGLHIYMTGIGIQQIFIIAFFALTIKFHQQMKADLPLTFRRRPLILLYVVYAVLGLITIRIIFRLIEYSQGYKSSIVYHEGYQYVFDSTVMLIALVLFNVVHPGRIMPGKHSELPSRKERKAAGKEYQWGRAREQQGDAPLSYESSTQLESQMKE